MNKIKRLTLLKKLQSVMQQNSQGSIARIKKIREIQNIRAELGMNVRQQEQQPARADENHQEVYNFTEKTKGTRQKDNDAAYSLLQDIQSGAIKPPLTKEQRAILAAFSGSGGNLIDPATKLAGSAYEYYTPKPIVDGVWGALKEAGFTGGRVLDPSAGTGIFAATAPDNALVESVELNPVSGGIGKILNDRPGFSTVVSSFESFASNTPDEQYDAIITNVPFGSNSARGSNKYDDNAYRNETLQGYFILRSLTKLKPGGLAAFIVPTDIVSGKDAQATKVRHQIQLQAEFVGGFRLPSHVFGTAGADVITDMIVLRKHSQDVGKKIDSIFQSGSVGMLWDAGVLWKEFQDGKYFSESGKKYVLGEFKPKDPNKFRDVDRVISGASIHEVGELIKKLPKASRINFSMLESTETTPIVYNEGDTIISGGVTMQMQNGQWVQVESMTGFAEYDALFPVMTGSAYNLYVHNPDIDSIRLFAAEAAMRGDIKHCPAWFIEVARSEKLKRGHLVAMAVSEVLDENLKESGFVFSDHYPDLTKDLLEHYRSTPENDVRPMVKKAVKLMKLHAAKGELSSVWRGLTQNNIEQKISDDGRFEGLRYQNKTKWVSIEDAKGIYGESFNINDDQWCIDGEGNVTRADDYFVGSPLELMADLDMRIASAEGETRAKLEAMRIEGTKRLVGVNLKRIQFDLHTPYIEADDKVTFLQGFINAPISTAVDGDREYPVIETQSGNRRRDIDRIHSAINHFIKEGTVRLGGNEYSSQYGATKQDRQRNALQAVRDEINRLNVQFDLWVRSHSGIMSKLEARFSSLESKRFRTDNDESPLNIAGMNPDRKLHGYQNAFVRAMSRGFEGINGFNVGLGKTATSLAAVQYAQSIGVKKKTLFVVPNSVLSNWRKEAGAWYDEEINNGCLYVGLREVRGKLKADSKYYDEDLLKILENKHSKIFMTYEAFERIKIRQETAAAYVKHMSTIDTAFAESERAAAMEAKKGREKSLTDTLTDKTGAAPYLEDMGIDSIVVDEAHNFKNAAQVYEFKGAKYLSLAAASRRGLDMMAKTWYIRDGHKDGILLLTATPITNSPLEFYSMMSIAVGSKRVLDTMAVQSVDKMMEAVCVKTSIDDLTIDGRVQATEVFSGLQNVELLRTLINNDSHIKSAEDVGQQIVVPDEIASVETVKLTGEAAERLEEYKLAYRYARAITRGKSDVFTSDDEKARAEEIFMALSDELNEDEMTIAHPFNLLTKMTTAMIDTDLDKVRTRYIVKSGRDELIEKWNAKPPKDIRDRLGSFGDMGNYTEKPRTNADGLEEGRPRYEVKVMAYPDGENAVLLDTTSPEIQSAFEAMAEKMEIDLDVLVSPKLDAFLQSFKREEGNPRGVDADGNATDVVRQIVFCDTLGALNKIKRLLTKRAGVPANEIAIVTGRTNNKPEEIQEVQDGFNATGEDRKYRIIIANEKAEVGINLQKGTQAIHHLTIGWTPDSLIQRNGRGVRQGNQTTAVSVYYYDADGTFDQQKRSIVRSKANWIDSVMKSDGADRVRIEGMISEDELDAMISSMGDADAVAKMQADIADRKQVAFEKSIRDQQEVAASTIKSARRQLQDIETLWKYLEKSADVTAKMIASQADVRKKLDNAKSEKTVARLSAQIDQTKAKAIKQILSLFERCGIRKTAADIPEGVESQLNGYPGFRPIEDGWRLLLELDIKKDLIEEDAPIHAEYQGTIDHTNLMIEEASNKFKELSSEDGAIGAGMLESMTDRALTHINGKPVYKGMFILGNDWSGFINDDGDLLPVKNDGSPAHSLSIRNTYFNRGEKAFYPSEREAKDIILRIAEAEDKAEAEMRRAWMGALPSDSSNEIRMARKVQPKQWLDASKVVLKGVAFPYIVMSSYDFISGIPEETQNLVESKNTNKNLITLKDGVDYEIVDGPVSADELCAVFKSMEFSKVSDFTYRLNYANDDSIINQDIALNAMVKMFIEAGDISESMIRGHIAEEAKKPYPSFYDMITAAVYDRGGKNASIAFGSLGLKLSDKLESIFGDVFKDAQAAKMAEWEKAKENRNASFEGENGWILKAAVFPVVQDLLLSNKDTDTVAIGGRKTFQYKELIKEYGYNHKPDGANGPKWNGVDKRWEISKGSAKALYDARPELFKDGSISIVAA